MRRTKLVLAMVVLLTMMMAVGAAPAMADDIDRDCFPFCNGNHHNHNDFDHHDFDENDFFINDIDDLDDLDEDFAELDDCEFVGFDGDEAVFACDVDFD